MLTLFDSFVYSPGLRSFYLIHRKKMAHFVTFVEIIFASTERRRP